MPMIGTPLYDNEGRRIGIACSRGPRRKRCATCEQLGALECDGCDKPLCAECAVATRKNVDFCPWCAKPLFQEWCKGDGAKYRAPAPGVDSYTHRLLRRAAFREWALANSKRFEPLIGAITRRSR